MLTIPLKMLLNQYSVWNQIYENVFIEIIVYYKQITMVSCEMQAYYDILLSYHLGITALME